jgi:hypothetical protein
MCIMHDSAFRSEEQIPMGGVVKATAVACFMELPASQPSGPRLTTLDSSYQPMFPSSQL